MSESFFRQRALSLSIILSLLVLAVDAPPWMRLFAIAMFGWRSLSESMRWKPASKTFTTILGFALFAQVFLQFRTLFGQDPSTTLLVGLTSLKILDYNGDRDRKVLVLLGFILLALKPLFSLDITWVPALIVSFAGLWASLLDPAETHVSRYLSRLFLAAVPTTAFLFFLFPRLIVPWAEGQSDPGGSHIGFTDTLDPGSVSDVAESNELAFRAHFEKANALTPANLYWRGAVLTEVQGLRWLPPRHRFQIEQDARRSGPSLHYQVLLEPNARQYVFSLETPLSIRTEDLTILRHPMGVFRTSITRQKEFAYEGWSDLLDHPRDPPDEHSTAVPPLGPQTQALVERFRAEAHSPAEKIAAVHDFFVGQKLQYNLHPGKTDSIEDFLFGTKRGFCEHFAGTAASLLRALGLPTRVVVGFQGGRYNPYGDFWRITSRDAHAWIEVFRDDHWERQDPTAWVAPLRPRLGGQDYFDLSDAERIEWSKLPGLVNRDRLGFRAWFGSLNDMLENANYNWTNFLLEFDRASQAGLWRGIGEHIVLSLLTAVFAIIVIAILLRWVQSPARRTSEMTLLMEDVFRWGSARRLTRAPSETPRHYFERLRAAEPALRDMIDSVLRSYERSVYAGREPERSARELRRQWRKCVRSL